MRKTILLISILILSGAAIFLYLYRGGLLFRKILGGKGITEGVIEYDITYPKLDPNSMLSSGLPDKAYLRFKNNDMSNDMSGMMGLISITYISKEKTRSVEQGLTLINKKYAADIPADDLKRLNDSYVTTIEPGKNKMEIAGYKCKEVIVTLANGEKVHMYYTNDIGIENPNWSNPYSKIDGVLMDFQMERYGVAMHLKAKSVLDQEVDDEVFKISEDSKKIPYPELEKILMELTPASD